MMKMKKNIFFCLFVFFVALFLTLLSSSSVSVPVLLNPPLPDHHHHYSPPPPPPPPVVGCGKANHLSSSVFCWALELCAASLLRQPKTGDWKATIKNNFCCGDPSSSASVLQPISAFSRSKATRKLLLLLIPTDSSFSLERGGGGGGGGMRLQEKQNYHADFSTHSKKVAIAVPAAFLLCCALLCPCFRSKKKEPSEQPVLELISSKDFTTSSIHGSTNSERTLGTLPPTPPSPLRVPPSPPRFSMSSRLNRVGSVYLNVNQITKATQNFSQSHVIGEGGFGTVYKAELPDGQVFAIKRARKEHFQALRTEFSSEVELLAKIEHRSLVRLLGYINKGNERIIISEYIPNGTLREHLDCQHGKILDFSQRLEIAIDVAHALTYLHLYAEKPVIHRDVKSSNILLTESFRAKVSDFGFARIVATDEGQSHVLTKVKGTAGYLDPEYLRTHQLTPKSDVFSFGILLLEILSGRRPVEMKRDVDERITIRWAFKKYTQGRMRDILDPLLEEVVHGEVLIRMFGLAFECAAPTRADRPAMKQVGETLWEIRKEYGKNLRRE